VLAEEFIEHLAHGSLLRIKYEAPLMPAVSEGCRPTERLSELCANGHGCCNSRGDLLPLPLCERCDHRVEEPPCRSRRIDRLLERDQVGVCRIEDVSKLKELLRVAGEPRQLRKDEACDPPVLQVPEHSLALRVVGDIPSGHRVEAIDLGDQPTLQLRVGASSPLVMFGTLAPDLVLGRDANPDTDTLFHWHTASARNDVLAGHHKHPTMTDTALTLESPLAL
jgi:hypothetical protein